VVGTGRRDIQAPIGAFGGIGNVQRREQELERSTCSTTKIASPDLSRGECGRRSEPVGRRSKQVGPYTRMVSWSAPLLALLGTDVTDEALTTLVAEYPAGSNRRKGIVKASRDWHTSGSSRRR
jgi:hypothetical protein